MEYIYMTCFIIWCLFSLFKVYFYKKDISKKKYAKIITSQLRSSYIKEKRFKELYTYDNKAFSECNFLYDYFVEKADVLLNKRLDHSLYRSYETFFSAGIIVWFLLFYSMPKSFDTLLKVVLCVICGFCALYSFYFYQCYYSKEITYRDDPDYKNKIENDRSFRWGHYVAPDVNAKPDQIIKDAEELADLFY